MKKFKNFVLIAFIAMFCAANIAAQETTKEIILYGVIHLDKNCSGGLCEVFSFKFSLENNGIIKLKLLDYYPSKATELPSQVPLEYVNKFKEVINKAWPKATMVSEGLDTSFLLFKARKKTSSLEEAQKIIEAIEKKNGRWKIEFYSYSAN